MPTAIEIPQSMKNPEIESDEPGVIPAVKVVEITDPTSAGESIEILTQDLVQLESRPFRARRVVVSLGGVVVVFHSTSVAVRARTKLQNGLTAFVTFGPESRGTFKGLMLGPDRVLAISPGKEVQLVVSAGYESIAFLFRPETLQSHLQSWQSQEQLSEGFALLTPAQCAAFSLYQFGRRLIDVAEEQPKLFDLPQTQVAAQNELVETLLEVLQSTAPVESASQETTRQSYSRIVELAEDFALLGASERIQLADLCQATGVCERTLQYAFKEVMGMTPMSYLTRLRLHRVRQSLRLADPESTTVTAEAARFGFWHFSDFSRAYKKCFDELPSETLRHAAEAKP